MTAKTKSTPSEFWVPETHNGVTVGWLVLDKKTGQIVRAIHYADAPK